jgi:hypothetical protein
MIIVGGQPVVVSDQLPGVSGGGGAAGQNVHFARRTGTDTWAKKQVATVLNTALGPSIAHDATLGYAIAYEDRTVNALYVTTSMDGVTWSTPDPVHNSGSGGFWPSIAVHPTFHDPSVAYHFCDKRAGIAEGSCRPSDDALKIEERIAGVWREHTVDTGGGYAPKLGFLPAGKHVVAYRDPVSGVLKLAVER